MLHAFSYQRSVSICFLLHKNLRPYSFISPLHTKYPIKSLGLTISNDEALNFFDHILQQCTTIQHCKQVHSQIVLTRTYGSPFLAARLVSVYARFGNVFYARKVFDFTPFGDKSNSLLWNSIIRANVTHGYYEVALELYGKMRKLGVVADGFTFPIVLRACAYTGSANLCRNVHSHVLQLGFKNHLHVVNELIGVYAKLEQMNEARKLFDKMLVRNYVSWNTMVSGYSFNYDSVGASEMFWRMELEGLEPNPVSWTSLLSSHSRCGRLEDTMELFDMMRMKGVSTTAEALAVVLSVCVDLASFDKGKVIHGYVICGGFEDYLFVKNALLSVYGRSGDVRDAQKLFNEMKIKNLVTWNALISSFAESGYCDEAFSLFSQLQKSDIDPTVRPNVISWSAIICGFATSGRGEESLALFRQMQLSKVEVNSVAISSVLSICAELASLSLGREIHGHVTRAAMDGNVLVGNGLVNMYMKCGSFQEGNLVFEKITGRDLISWNSMISGYGMHGLGKNALKTFDQMIRSDIKPDKVTFIAVLSACSHSGLVSEGRWLFEQMISNFTVKPQIKHYACLVDLLGRAGLLQEASDVVKNMPIEPNACVWGALLNSCRMHNKDTDVAEKTASQIFGLKSERTGSYILLSNIFAASGRWDDSKRVRLSARTQGLKKTSGLSWIEVKKKVFTFTADNTVQEGLERVHEVLHDLAIKMESESYLLDEYIEQIT